MLGMSVSKSLSSEDAHGAYEYGEYDGLIDVDAILHPNAGAGGSMKHTASSTAVGSGVGGYANYVSLHGEHANGTTPAPPGRGTVTRKPPRGSASQSRNGTPRHPTALVASISLEPGDSLEPGIQQGAATANGRSAGARKPPTDDVVVHLPAIANTGFGNANNSNPNQGRKRAAEGAPPPRSRAAASAHSPSNVGHSGNTRTTASGAKSVTSASNLKSLQAGVNGDGVVGANSNNFVSPIGRAGTGGAVKPPFHAPPLTGIANKSRQQSIQPIGDEVTPMGVTKTMAGGDSNNSNGMSSTKTNGWLKDEARRLERRTPGAGDGASQLSAEESPGNDAASNSFKPRTMAQLAASEFPRERMKEKVGVDAGGRRGTMQPADKVGEGDDAHGEEGNSRAKVNTSPAAVTSRAHVWAGDYSLGSTIGNGPAELGVVPMPKVTPGHRPFAGSLKPAAASSNGPISRPHPKVTSPSPTVTAPVTPGATAGTRGNNHDDAPPTDLLITPLRKVFPRPQKPATTGLSTNAAAGALPHVPLTHPPTSTPGPSRPPGMTGAAVVALDENDSKVASASPHVPTASAASKTSLAAGGPHSPTLSQRRIVMNAVDTTQHAHLHSSLGSQPLSGQTQKTTAGPSVVPSTGAAATQASALPYSDERRAALEAWADLPVMAVTIRSQSPKPTQLAREAARASARQGNARQMCVAVSGQRRQEIAGEPFELDYDVHNVVVQLRHRNRPLMMAYPPRLPLEVEMRPRMRRQRTPRSFYGEQMPHVGDTWFRDALKDARLVQSPNIEEMEKREEAEFIRNGGDPATRRNRYAQSNNPHGQQQQHQQNRADEGDVAAAPVAPVEDIEAINRNAVRMEQSAS